MEKKSKKDAHEEHWDKLEQEKKKKGEGKDLPKSPNKGTQKGN